MQDVELIKNYVHMNRLKGQLVTQLTLDDDFNVPDINDDIYKIITSDGKISTSDVKVSSGKVIISGSLLFKFLYSCDTSNDINHMEGSIPFTETINIDELNDSDNISLKWNIDDLRIDIINTRKINAKSIISLAISYEELTNCELTKLPENYEGIICQEKAVDITKLVVNKRDVFRIKDFVNLPGGKPNIGEVLWEQSSLKSHNVRLDDGKLLLNGEISLFLLYRPDGENIPIQWFDTTLPFSGELEVSECLSDMYGDIEVSIGQSLINIKNDSDDEARVFEADIVLDIGIKLYLEETTILLTDAYSTEFNVVPTYNSICYNSLLTKNISKCRILDKLKLNLSGRQVLQILSGTGTAHIDEITCDNGIVVEGAVTIKIMFICSDDKTPINTADEVIPFNHIIECDNISNESLCFIRPFIETLNLVMTGSNELEVKADVILDGLVLNNKTDNIISTLETTEFSKEELANRPGMIAYRPTANDSLWSIAKQFNTTMEHIIEENEIKNENIHIDRLLFI